ncbi:MAG: hypothetical protein JW904_07340 [Spirochaetales bacterium]|nr:hypothetical protein [Spirochaetales bacterium]
MAGGVITVEKARADVYFLSGAGKDVFPPDYNMEVKFSREFGGVSLQDAVAEAKKYAVGVFTNKVQQKIRGKGCTVVVRDIEIRYSIKYGFNKVRV